MNFFLFRQIGYARFFMGSIGIVLTAMLDILLRLLCGMVVDHITMITVKHICVGFLLVGFLVIVKYLTHFFIANLAVKQEWELKNQIERHLVGNAAGEESNISSVMNHIQVDVSNILSYERRMYESFVPSLLLCFAALLIFTAIHPVLIVVSIISLLIPMAYIKRMSSSMKTLYDHYYDIRDKILENERKVLHSLEYVKMCREERHILEEHKKQTALLNQANRRPAVKEALLSMPTLAITFCITMSMVGCSVYLEIQGYITMGEVFIAILLVDTILEPIMTMEGTMAAYHRATSSYDRIKANFEIQNEVPFSIFEKDIDLDTISIHSLSYAYPNTDITALNIKNMKFVKGQINLIQGENGSGKSTLFMLLSGADRSYSGDIFFGSTEIKSIFNMQQWIAVCPQEILLLPGTIKENLLIYDEKDDREWTIEEEALLKKLELWKEIMNMEKGFNTLLCENGAPLSIGQRQRVMLARMLFKRDTRILLLDEPTTGFSYEIIGQLAEILLNLAFDRIIIVASHDEEFISLLNGHTFVAEV